MTADLAATVEAVLEKHAAVRIVWVPSARPGVQQLTYVCSCSTTLAAAVTKGEAHRTHVAGAVAQALDLAIGADALRHAAKDLREAAAVRMDSRGPHDARGAAVWDAASWLTDRADALTPKETP